MDWVQILKAVLPAAALIAAVIAAFVAIVGHLLNRSNAKLAAQISRKNARLAASLEVDKFLATSRQSWIDSMREDMVQFVTLCTETDPAKRDYDKMIERSARIEIRMNPNDEDYETLISSMGACINLQDEEADIKAVGRFLSVSQKILKREWEVVKADLRKINEEDVE